MKSPTRSQQLAIAARGNVLVAAGAGTGKTSTLVQRCMALLETGGSLERILMVTFTEAAAMEMRGRIREALQTKATAPVTDSSAAIDTQIAREHFETQLALLDTALISTLHSFCLQLVREHFDELGIDPDFRVLDERQTRPIVQQLLDDILEHCYASQDPRALAVQDLVRASGEDRLRTMILQIHRFAQSLAAPEDWFERQRQMFQQRDPGTWREWLIAGFVEWRSTWLTTLNQFSQNPAVNLAIAALRSAPDHPRFEQVTRALSDIRTADETDANWPRGSKKSVRDELKDFFNEAAFLASITSTSGTDPLVEDWQLARRDMLALLELTAEFTAAFNRVKRESGGADFADLEQLALRVLRNASNGKPTAAALQWQQRLDYVFVDEYQDINAAQDSILSALSRTEPAGNRFLVGDVKQSIYRFRLADPSIFRAYERHWNGKTGCARIPLRDNFRSDAGILAFINPFFRALMRESIGGVAYEDLEGGNTIAGTSTGSAELHSAVPQNCILREAQSLDPVENVERPAECNSAAQQSKTLRYYKPTTAGAESPTVELNLIVRSEAPNGNGENGTEEDAVRSEVADLLSSEREARLIALRLRELKNRGFAVRDKDEVRPVRWSDMAILMRSPAPRVEAFAKEFAALNIPLQAARGGFFDSAEVRDLVCLLQLVDNPMQDIPMLAVLRSPLVGMSLPELTEIRAGESTEQRPANFWLAVRKFHQRGRPGPAWSKLDLFLRQLDRWRAFIRHSSLSDCLEAVLAETHYESLLRASPRGAQQIANVRRLLELARAHDPFQRQGLYRFLRFIEAQEEDESEAAPETSDAVRLMSVHRSKGLEFPVVVVAALGAQFNFRDLQDHILLDDQYGLCSKIVASESDQRYPSLPYWLARRRRKRELLGEELRLLYVAMTRARDKLLLTGVSNRKGPARWAAEDARELTDPELSSARSSLDWLRLWLPQVTRDENWRTDREGASDLFQWTLYAEDDTALGRPSVPPVEKQSAIEPPSADLKRQLAWSYPSVAATQQRAKSSVTELRRSQEDDDAEPAAFIRNGRSFQSARTGHALSAAEAGVAHHRFLQRVSLTHNAATDNLREQASQMRDAGWLNALEFEALNFDALAGFWQSDLGQRIRHNASSVRRELQFTARFNPRELLECGLQPVRGLPTDEFVVVQGMVDLAVMLPDEIWVVDFKTDAVDTGGIPDRAKSYEPQLKLYARALSRIYRRNVTRCCLHFLAQQATVAVEA